MKRLRERLMRHPWTRVALRVRDRYAEDRVGLLAGALTYHGFLSLFPLLLIGATVLGIIFENDPTSRATWAARFSVALPGIGGMVEDLLYRASRSTAAVGTAGVLGLFWTGTGAVRAASQALGQVYGRPPQPSFIKRVIWSFGTMIVLGLIFAASALASGIAGSLSARGAIGLLVGVVAFSIGLVIDFALFMSAYRLLRRGAGPPLRDLIAGSALAALGWSALRLIGVWYFRQSLSGAQAVYGVFAGTVAVLVILSVGARLFMAGAALNAVLSEREGEPVRHQAVLASGMRS